MHLLGTSSGSRMACEAGLGSLVARSDEAGLATLNDIHEHIRRQQIPRHMCVPCLSLLKLFNPSRNKV